MPVVKAADAPRFQLPGAEVTVLAAPSLGSADVCTWRLSVSPSRAQPEPHTLDQAEIFMVISGTVRVTPDGEELGPGDAIVVPPGDPIALVNTGDVVAELYVAIRSGFVGTMADGSTVSPPWAR